MPTIGHIDSQFYLYFLCPYPLARVLYLVYVVWNTLILFPTDTWWPWATGQWVDIYQNIFFFFTFSAFNLLMYDWQSTLPCLSLFLRRELHMGQFVPYLSLPPDTDNHLHSCCLHSSHLCCYHRCHHTLFSFYMRLHNFILFFSQRPSIK